MGIGCNFLFGGGSGTQVERNANIFIQSSEPSETKGLWVKSDITPESIRSLTAGEFGDVYGSSWSTITHPDTYSTFAVVGDYVYLLGNDSGQCAKAYLKDETLSFTTISVSSTILFTSTAVIGSVIYASKDGSDLEIYQMNTADSQPDFSLVLPTVSAFTNPRICTDGTKLYAMLSAALGTKYCMMIDPSAETPMWESLASLTDDTTRTAIIYLNGFLYVVGTMSSGYKNYALDLGNSAAVWQPSVFFPSAGCYFPALSTHGGILRIITSGYATTARNSLSLIDGIWKTYEQTGLTLFTETCSSYSIAYHTPYAIYVKDKSNSTLYKLDVSKADTGLDDNTLILIKGEGAARPLTAELDNYEIIEDIFECYHLAVSEGEETLTRLDIAWYNSETEEWENI